MAEVKLAGCAPEPLMAYLKALGVFRLVAEQADPGATLAWRGGTVCLHSGLGPDELVAFFLDHYRPTPILAPWNGGSGFYGGGSEPLNAIAGSTGDRFRLYRETIDHVRCFVPKSKPKDENKAALLIRCRSELADEVVSWLDVCFVLREEGQSFFPLLGTGGNDGRLDFTNNFMQRLAETIPLQAKTAATGPSRSYLRAALFADTLVSLGKMAIGQFNPGGIGGPNGTQGSFEAGSRVNPWDFILMIEGTLLFAGSVARRLGASEGAKAVFPFSVDSVAVGYGSAAAAEEATGGSRAELWLPLWDEPFTLAEIRHLFAEGRAQLGRRQARNAVEFALAVNLLGVNRGVKAFARYGFLKRNGLAFLATPLGRVQVGFRPEARLLEDPPLAAWIERWRSACSDKDKTPARYQSVLRSINRVIFSFANRGEQGSEAAYFVEVLAALGRAERTLATGLRFAKENYLGPLQGLNPEWMTRADDGSPEFRLAAALAGLRGERDVLGPFRVFLEEVEFKGRYANWSPGSASAVWSNRALAANLAAVFLRRQLEAFRGNLSGMPLLSARPAPLADVVAFLNGDTNDEKLAALLWAIIAVEQPSRAALPARSSSPVPFAFGVLRLVVEPAVLRPEPVPRGSANGRFVWSFARTTKPDEANARPDPEIFHQIATARTGDVNLALDRAARRLTARGLVVHGYRNRRQGAAAPILNPISRPERLLAAMLFPLAADDLQLIANDILYPPQSEE